MSNWKVLNSFSSTGPNCTWNLSWCDPIVHVFFHIMWLSCDKHIQCTCTGSHNMYMFCKSVRSHVIIINYSDSQGTLECRWGTSNVLAAWSNWRTLSCETKIDERTTYYRWEVPPPWGTNWKNIWRRWEIILSFTFTLTSKKVHIINFYISSNFFLH